MKNLSFRAVIRAVLALVLVGAAVDGHLGIISDTANGDLGPIDALAGAAVTFYFTSE